MRNGDVVQLIIHASIGAQGAQGVKVLRVRTAHPLSTLSALTTLSTYDVRVTTTIARACGHCRSASAPRMR